MTLGDIIVPLDESGKFGMQKKHKTNSETTFKMMVGFWRTFPASMMNRGEKKTTLFEDQTWRFHKISVSVGGCQHPGSQSG